MLVPKPMVVVVHTPVGSPVMLDPRHIAAAFYTPKKAPKPNGKD